MDTNVHIFWKRWLYGERLEEDATQLSSGSGRREPGWFQAATYLQKGHLSADALYP